MQPINVEEVFDVIAKSSAITNLPETDFDKWKEFRQDISQEQVDVLNEFRVKFGLQIIE